MTSLLREDTPVPMPPVRFGDDHLMAGRAARARNREPDHAGADDENLHVTKAGGGWSSRPPHFIVPRTGGAPRRADPGPGLSSRRKETGVPAPPLVRDALRLAAHLLAAIRTSGAAALTSASTWSSKFLKFFWNMSTSFFAVSAKSARSFQVLTG